MVLLVLLGGGLGAGLTLLFTSGSSSATPTITTTTTVQTVSTGNISKTVSATGTVSPSTTSDLDFGVSGRVTAVDVAVGQSVAAGQALATVDSSVLAATLAQAQAALANDQSQLSTDQDNGASATQLASDNAQIASAQTQVNSAQTSLNDATLTSPIAGQVAAVNLTVGQQVSGSGTSSASSSAASGTGSSGSGSTGGSGSSSGVGSSGSSGFGSGSSSSSGSSGSSSSSPEIQVVSTGSYVVDASVGSADVGQVQTGDQATVTGTGAASTIYGTVASVGLVASSSSGVSQFPVVIDVTGSPSGLFGGASATVSIITEQLYDVTVVPTTAVHYSGANTTVTLDQNGNKVARNVTIGASSGGMTQVTSGLSTGDRIFVTEISFRGGAGGTAGRSGLFGGRGGLGGAGGFGGFGGGGGGGFGGGGGARAFVGGGGAGG